MIIEIDESEVHALLRGGTVAAAEVGGCDLAVKARLEGRLPHHDPTWYHGAVFPTCMDCGARLEWCRDTNHEQEKGGIIVATRPCAACAKRRARCTHDGIGLPGCSTCDPRTWSEGGPRPDPGPTPQRAIFDEVANERALQDAKWGGGEHDDTHGPDRWLGFLVAHVRKAIGATSDAGEVLTEVLAALQQAGDRLGDGDLDGLAVDPATYRRQLVRIAGLAVAAIEVHDRAQPAPAQTAIEPPAAPDPYAALPASRDTRTASLFSDPPPAGDWQCACPGGRSCSRSPDHEPGACEGRVSREGRECSGCDIPF